MLFTVILKQGSPWNAPSRETSLRHYVVRRVNHCHYPNYQQSKIMTSETTVTSLKLFSQER